MDIHVNCMDIKLLLCIEVTDWCALKRNIYTEREVLACPLLVMLIIFHSQSPYMYIAPGTPQCVQSIQRSSLSNSYILRLICETFHIYVHPQDSSQYRFGKTKLFFRAGQVAYLERLRSQRLQEASVCVQRRVRGWLQRKRYRVFRAATVAVQARARGLLARR